MKINNNIEDFELLGQWWIPGKEEEVVGGTFAYSEGDADLHLSIIGSLLNRATDSIQRRYPIILGVLVDGRKVTLADCAEIHFAQSPITQHKTQSFRTDMAFIDGHFSSIEELSFSKILLSYSHLDDWVRQDRIDYSADFSKLEIDHTFP